MQQMLYKRNAEGGLTTVEKKVLCPKGQSLQGCGLDPVACLLVAEAEHVMSDIVHGFFCGTSPDDIYILAS